MHNMSSVMSSVKRHLNVVQICPDHTDSIIIFDAHLCNHNVKHFAKKLRRDHNFDEQKVV